jgi:hypothetical protein
MSGNEFNIASTSDLSDTILDRAERAIREEPRNYKALEQAAKYMINLSYLAHLTEPLAVVAEKLGENKDYLSTSVAAFVCVANVARADELKQRSIEGILKYAPLLPDLHARLDAFMTAHRWTAYIGCADEVKSQVIAQLDEVNMRIIMEEGPEPKMPTQERARAFVNTMKTLG